MLLKPPWKSQVKPKMAILAPLLAHLGALGRHLGFNLVHLGAKLGAKRHLNGHGVKDPPESFPRGWRISFGWFFLVFYKHFCIGGVPHQTQKSDPKVLPSCLPDGAK